MAKRNLSKDIQKSLNSWNECSNFKLGGVGNLSRSDLDVLQMYIETIETYGTYQGYLMKPLGPIGKVLEVYGYER